MIKKKLRAIFLLLLLLAISACVEEDKGESYDVYIVDPPFNSERLREDGVYTMLASSSKPWNIQVVIPHLKDDYWTGVVYGLIDTAGNLGINLTIHEAGGYEYLDVQRAQIEKIINDEEVDGIIISSVSLSGLNDLVLSAAEKGIPVIDLINGIDSPRISARVASDFYDHGQAVAARILELMKDDGSTMEVGWFPGPSGAGWVEAAHLGFSDTLEGSGVIVRGPYFGDTGHSAQESLLRDALSEYSGINYIAGTAVTAEVAVSVLQSSGRESDTGVSSFYYSAGVHRGLERRDIDAAPTDLQVLQARIALDTIVRIIEKKPYHKHIGPRVLLVDSDNVGSYDSSTSLAPAGFRIKMSVEAP